MRSFSELTKSLGRASSVRQNKRATVLPEKPPLPSGDGLKEDTNAEGNSTTPKAAKSADDLFATFDALTRPLSQDIARPFDNIPRPRTSEANSVSKRKKNQRKSLVPNIAPTVDTLQDSLTPFGDAFKSFTQEPVQASSQQAAATTAAGPASPSIAGLPSLTSKTTLEEESVNNSAFLSPASALQNAATAGGPANGSAAQRNASTETDRTRMMSPTPSSKVNRTSGYFKGLLGVMHFRDKVTTYWQPGMTPEKEPGSPSAPGVPDAYKEKNGSSSSLGGAKRGLGSFLKPGRRGSKDVKEGPTSPTTPKINNSTPAAALAEENKATNGTEEALQPPALPAASADDGKGSPRSSRYAHGVLLHPITEDDIDVSAAGPTGSASPVPAAA